MKRVLVTGANGFVGRHALAPLLERGYEVHAAGLGPRPAFLPPSAQWHDTDLLTPAAREALLEAARPSHLLHFAWYAAHGLFWTSPENLRWVEASLALMRRFREAGGVRLVAAGSCAEYQVQEGACSEEETPCRPSTLYGVCKNAVQEILGAYSRATGLGSAWGRIFFLYGPSEHPDRLVASVIRALLEGRAARCTDGLQVRDFLHVEDVAAAFVALLDSDVTGPVNVASGRAVEVRTVVEAIARQLGRPELVELGALPTRPGEPPTITARTRRLEREVGFEPSLGMEEGLARTIESYRKESGTT
jgi:nucleoside-diphosphate-sugar epimerase